MSDNVLHDSPREFLSDAVSSGECDVQSVIPLDDGTYSCGCSCKDWVMTAESLQAGLELARKHTAETAAAKAVSARAGG
ncbi:MULTISPECIES: hypothetical protein [Mycobacterium]|uniref:Uncharacterized protein n=1 Tax=Mycobacterium paraseoulense TaxID=590652 RepID=A0A1X0IFV0_9MYCO|nr:MULTISPECIES: hypothetical protein [Mycobacterium]OBH01492.1 hypothetical protein A9X04_27155 [Mycobacterium sp. E3247]OBH25302.1 hypothetical protein A5692_02675 [Mycobacterium sp. E342]ORB45388.1 hypothetical protein BST39_03945 [Mycobacterium paraseoulense]BBZ70484.1 hypothetical protein MPRS_15770 [Mycobacterium paraseoulense]